MSSKAPECEELRRLGYDVVTPQTDGRSSAPDPAVLARAHALGRSNFNRNRRHYEWLHRQGAAHSGIVSATQHLDHAALAGRIHVALAGLSPGPWCLRVNRPRKP